jgi:hypothetical protein
MKIYFEWALGNAPQQNRFGVSLRATKVVNVFANQRFLGMVT